MDIRNDIRLLRQAADALEQLLVPAAARKLPNQNAATAKKIAAGPRKKRKGLHWTQRPENKKRLAAILKKAAARRAEVARG